MAKNDKDIRSAKAKTAATQDAYYRAGQKYGATLSGGEKFMNALFSGVNANAFNALEKMQGNKLAKMSGKTSQEDKASSKAALEKALKATKTKEEAIAVLKKFGKTVDAKEELKYGKETIDSSKLGTTDRKSVV